MSRSLLGAAALLTVVVAVILMWPTGGDEPTVADLSVDDLANLDVGARELVALAARGDNRSFHARYVGRDDRPIEVWVLGDRVRQQVEHANGKVLTQRQGDEVTRCRDEGAGWVCEDVTSDTADAEDVVFQDAIDQLTADLAGASVTANDQEIAGVAVRCFAFASDDLPAEICLTSQGVLARLSAGDETLQLTLLDEDVDDRDFVLPEAVAAG